MAVVRHFGIFRGSKFKSDSIRHHNKFWDDRNCYRDTAIHDAMSCNAFTNTASCREFWKHKLHRVCSSGPGSISIRQPLNSAEFLVEHYWKKKQISRSRDRPYQKHHQGQTYHSRLDTCNLGADIWSHFVLCRILTEKVPVGVRVFRGIMGYIVNKLISRTRWNHNWLNRSNKCTIVPCSLTAMQWVIYHCIYNVGLYITILCK